jgi:hypothetical protein
MGLRPIAAKHSYLISFLLGDVRTLSTDSDTVSHTPCTSFWSPPCIVVVPVFQTSALCFFMDCRRFRACTVSISRNLNFQLNYIPRDPGAKRRLILKYSCIIRRHIHCTFNKDPSESNGQGGVCKSTRTHCNKHRYFCNCEYFKVLSPFDRCSATIKSITGGSAFDMHLHDLTHDVLIRILSLSDVHTVLLTTRVRLYSDWASRPLTES